MEKGFLKTSVNTVQDRFHVGRVELRKLEEKGPDCGKGLDACQKKKNADGTVKQ